MLCGRALPPWPLWPVPRGANSRGFQRCRQLSDLTSSHKVAGAQEAPRLEGAQY